MRSRVRGELRAAAVRAYGRLPLRVRRALFSGRARYCPVCDSWVRRFVAAGVNSRRPDARCPVCGSEERHRLAWHFLKHGTGTLSGRVRDVLHMGPARCIETRLRELCEGEYIAADLHPKPGQVRADITDLPFETARFDLAWCTHVLEHVQDDEKAMRELARVVSTGGLCVIQIPVTAKETCENPDITDPDARREAFGCSDHVRCYGPDVTERLAEAGFDVRMIRPEDVLSREEQVLLAIPDDEQVFACWKP